MYREVWLGENCASSHPNISFKPLFSDGLIWDIVGTGFWKKKRSEIYQPLNPARREIRLVHILPALRDSAPLKCSLTTFSLDESPHFEALSYAWGDLEVTRPIKLCSERFDATVNLEVALRSLRQKVHTRTFWIDALCINQNDIIERGHQVKQMRLIYSQAWRVVVWLGEEANDSNIALDAMHAIGSGEGIHLVGRSELEEEERPLITHKLASMVFLLQRSWWRRVWTVQEAVIPKQLVFRCGNRELLGDTVFGVFKNYFQHTGTCCSQWLTKYSEEKTIFHELVKEIWVLHRFRRDKSIASPVCAGIMNLRFRACFDARDKVYGFLGLTNQSEDFISPDYSKTVQEIYEAAALQLAWERQNLEIFSYVEAKSSTEKFPSWVPQWLAYSNVVSKEYDGLQGRLGRSQHYRTSKSPFYLVSLASGKAGVQGITIDRVGNIGASPVSHFTGDNIDAFKEWNRLSGAAETPELKYVDQTTTLEDAFWLTLVNGVMVHPTLEGGILASTSIHKSWFLEWWAFYQSSSYREASINLVTFNTSVTQATFGRRFFSTEKGYIGTGTTSMRRGDLVVVLDGGRLFHILRQTDGNFEADGAQFPQYTILGDAYVHGLMDGEVEALAQREGITKQKYVLV